jgi:hypothetical protein
MSKPTPEQQEFIDAIFGKVDYQYYEPQTSVLDQISFGIEKADTDIENLGIITRAATGMFPPDGVTDEEYDSLTFDQRRELLLLEREQKLAQKFPELYMQSMENGDSLATNFGEVFGTLATPTTLLPVGQSVKAAAAIGGGLGATYSLLDDVAKTGEVDLQKTGIYTGAGALIGGTVVGVASKLGKAKLDAQQQARSQLGNEIEQSVTKAVAEDVPPEQIPIVVAQETGVPVPSVRGHINSGSDKPVLIPRNKPEAINANETDKALNRAAGNTEAARGFWHGVDRVLGVTFTRMKKISEPIAFRVRKYEGDVQQMNGRLMTEVKPFMKMVKQMDNATRAQLNKHLMNSKPQLAIKVAQAAGYSQAPKIIGQVQKTLKELGTELKQQGYNLTDEQLSKFYFPRTIKDFNGLEAALSGQFKSVYERALQAKAKQLGISPDGLAKNVREEVFNNVSEGFTRKRTKSKLSSLEERTIKLVTDELEPFYENASESLMRHLLKSSAQIHKGKFFGRANRVIDDTGKALDIDKSVGELLGRDLANLDAAQKDALHSLLHSRFIIGEQNMGGSIRAIRNLGFASTLANPVSAMIQLGDMGVSAYANGMRNSIMAMIGATPKGFNRRLTWRDMGGDNIVAQEATNVGDTSNLLFKLFTLSGFRQIDNLGKNTAINASLTKGHKLAKKNPNKIRAKYQKGLGEAETQSLIDDLATGTMSERVKMYTLNELADIQPIFGSGVPQAYLDSPNGRILYMLKTWSLKQLDILRNDILIQARTNPAEALKNAIAFSLIVPVVGGTVEETRDFMLGRGFNPEDILTKNAPEQVLKLFGASEYVRDRYFSRGDYDEAVISTLAPPIPFLNSLGNGITNLATGNLEDATDEFIRDLPLVGRLYYNYFGGGLEKFQEWSDD